VSNVYTRDSDIERLHPLFREKIRQLFAAFLLDNLPFRAFECFRSPQRQDWLYQQGRTRPGAIVTYARAWESYHQYGLAVDFVLYEQGRWSWDTSGERAQWWRRLHELGRASGLEPLSFEKPHLQVAGLTVASLSVGTLPDGGDDSWADTLEAAAASWAGQPASPPFQLPTSRPPLDA